MNLNSSSPFIHFLAHFQNNIHTFSYYICQVKITFHQEHHLKEIMIK